MKNIIIIIKKILKMLNNDKDRTTIKKSKRIKLPFIPRPSAKHSKEKKEGKKEEKRRDKIYNWFDVPFNNWNLYPVMPEQAVEQIEKQKEERPIEVPFTTNASETNIGNGIVEQIRRSDVTHFGRDNNQMNSLQQSNQLDILIGESFLESSVSKKEVKKEVNTDEIIVRNLDDHNVYNKHLKFKTEPYNYYKDITITGFPTSNCQLSSVGRMHNILSINKNNKKKALDILNGLTQKQIIIDINTYLEKTLEAFLEGYMTKVIKTPYINTNKTEMTLYIYKWNNNDKPC